jgi:hypothetical protein
MQLLGALYQVRGTIDTIRVNGDTSFSPPGDEAGWQVAVCAPDVKEANGLSGPAQIHVQAIQCKRQSYAGCTPFVLISAISRSTLRRSSAKVEAGGCAISVALVLVVSHLTSALNRCHNESGHGCIPLGFEDLHRFARAECHRSRGLDSGATVVWRSIKPEDHVAAVCVDREHMRAVMAEANLLHWYAANCVVPHILIRPPPAARQHHVSVRTVKDNSGIGQAHDAHFAYPAPVDVRQIDQIEALYGADQTWPGPEPEFECNSMLSIAEQCWNMRSSDVPQSLCITAPMCIQQLFGPSASLF